LGKHVAFSDVTSVLALIISTIALWQTYSKDRTTATAEKKADLGASFIKLGSGSFRLKIWNKGKATARQVRIELPDEKGLIVPSEIEEKFPLETLEPCQSVELIAAVVMGTKRKHTVRLFWGDDFREKNEKTVYPTL
jgi:hypothetical protein